MNIELTEVIVAIVGVVVTWACKELASWLRAKSKNEKEKALIDRLEHSVSTSVGAITQTAVKKYIKNEAWTDNTKEIVKYSAIELVKQSLSPENLKALSDLYGDEKTDQIIDSMIEHRVLKNGS